MTQHEAGDAGNRWTQVRETVLMMELAVAQIESAMKDSDRSVAVLTDTFTTMAGQMGQIATTVNALSDDGEEGAMKARLRDATMSVSGMVNQSIIAFQFYDRLAQRLSHVNHSLAMLAELVADSARADSASEWTSLQQAIRAETGLETELSTSGGTSDGRFIAKVCPQVIELGPPNATIHKIDEHIVVADVEPLKNIYRRVLENLHAQLQSAAAVQRAAA